NDEFPVGVGLPPNRLNGFLQESQPVTRWDGHGDERMTPVHRPSRKIPATVPRWPAADTTPHQQRRRMACPRTLPTATSSRPMPGSADDFTRRYSTLTLPLQQL